MYLPIASALAKDAVARQARSALPDAPVTPYVEPLQVGRLTRARESLAAGLRRVAIVVEPPRCSEAR